MKVVAKFNLKASQFISGRIGLFESAKDSIDQSKPLAWFHCASLGEFEQARPIIESFKYEFSEYQIVVTFFSPSGYEVKKNYEHADHVFYLPFDTASNAKRWLDILSPKIVFFIKYEFWYHFYNEINERSIPLISASAIFRKDQIFFKKIGKLQRSILHKVSHFFVQNNTSVALLKSIDIDNITLTGDTRFDRVYEIGQQAEGIPLAAKFANSKKTWILGSVWEEDLEVCIPFINHDDSVHKFILAPHEVTEAGLVKIEKQIRQKSIRYSKATESNLDECDVLIIDNVGMLSSLYQYGDYAFVGGAYGKGLHNILEAATFGMPIFFGNKNYEKFQEATDLIRLEAAFAVADYHEFNEQLMKLNHEVASTTAQSYVKGNTGATDKIISYCKKRLKS
jgi:3-deoxy-D-manno-octulosonic-acid transferase